MENFTITSHLINEFEDSTDIVLEGYLGKEPIFVYVDLESRNVIVIENEHSQELNIDIDQGYINEYIENNI